MKRSSELLQRFIRFSEKNDLFQPGQSILVAVSGGVDSVVLLHLFSRLRHSWQLRLFAAHLNHQIRGAEADADEVFVKNLCKEMAIPFHSERRDVLSFAREQKLSIETAARELRYEFLQHTAQSLQCALVATAHNANDQAETILDHIMRGSGVAGLVGIPVKRQSIIRPLLFATREEILDYASEMNLAFREDSSNKSFAYRRNKIRHVLLKMIQEFNPEVVPSLFRLGRIMGDVEEVLQAQAEEAFYNCLKGRDDDKIILDYIQFLLYFKTIQKYVIQKALYHLGGPNKSLTFEQFEELHAFLAKHKSGKFHRLTTDIVVGTSASELYIGRATGVKEEIRIDRLPGNFDLWDQYILEIKQVAQSLEEILNNQDKSVAYVDGDKIDHPIIVRTVRPGDRFHPLGMRGSKKLSDFFIDEKVPFFERSLIPLVVCKTGIIWIGDMRLDDRFKVTENTRKILRLKLSKKK